MYVNYIFKFMSAVLQVNKIWSYTLHFQFVMYLATLSGGKVQRYF